MKKLALAVITTVFCLPAATWAQFSTHDLILEDNTGNPIVTLQAPLGGTPFQYVFPSTAAAVGAINYISGVAGSQASSSWLMPGSNGQVLQMSSGVPTWATVNTLPNGSGTNTILVWNGSSWVSNPNFSSDPANGNTSIGGDLTVSGPNVNLPAGSISNTELENSSITINTGAGLSGGATVPLGGSITLANTGVTGLTAGSGINLSGSTGNVTVSNTGLLAAAAGTGIGVSTAGGTATISNTGVTSITGTPNQVIASGSTGAVTLSTPQDIHNAASPTFSGMTLTGLAGSSAATEIVVSSGGVLQTRSIASLPTTGGGEPYVTFGAGSSTLTNNRVVAAGTGIDIVDAGSDNGNITINNTGLLGAAAGTGISVTTTSGTATISNTGVTNLNAGTGLSVSGTTGAITINNTGVTSITGTANQIIASGSTGAVTLSTPQNIHTGATPTFAGMTLTAMTNDNTIPTVVVSDGGVLKTRSVASLPGGFSGVTTNATLTGDGTGGNPLGINLANANTWSALQTFSSLATTGTTTLGDGGDNITVNATTGTFNVTGLSNDDTKTRVLVQDATTGQVYYRTASSLSGSAGWSLTGNAGTAPATNFMGTTDAQDVVFRSNNVERARILSTGPLQISSTAASTGEIRFQEPTAGGSEYSSFKAQAQASTINYSLPDTAGAVGDALVVRSQSGGSVVLDWANPNIDAGAGAILFARKTSDETRTSNSLASDSELKLAMTANTTYKISGTLYVERPSGNANIDLAFSVPGGTGGASSNSELLITWSGFVNKSGGTTNAGNGVRNQSGVGAINNNSLWGVTLGNDMVFVWYSGVVVTGSTAGDLELQWGLTSNSGSIKVLKNSVLTAEIID